MVRLRILLDCDGVIADFHTPCLKILNEIGGTNHKTADIHEWDIFTSLGIDKETKKATYDAMNTPGWCASLEPYPGAIDGVRELQKLGDIYIVTSPMRGDTWHREREMWVWHKLGIEPKHVVHTASKHIVHGDVLIDDREANVVAWQKERVNEYGVGIKWITYPEQPNHYVGHSYQDWPSLIEFLKERFIGEIEESDGQA